MSELAEMIRENVAASDLLERCREQLHDLRAENADLRARGSTMDLTSPAAAALVDDVREISHGLQAAALKFEAIQLRLQSLETQLAEILARTEKQ
jgi:hypothetical protein